MICKQHTKVPPSQTCMWSQKARKTAHGAPSGAPAGCLLNFGVRVVKEKTKFYNTIYNTTTRLATRLRNVFSNSNKWTQHGLQHVCETFAERLGRCKQHDVQHVCALKSEPFRIWLSLVHPRLGFNINTNTKY